MSTPIKDVNFQVDSFIDKLKRRQISGSHKVALETCHLLMRVISAARWNHPDQLISQIRQLGKTLVGAQPKEFSCGNVIRRVLSIIRDEVEVDNDSNSGMISSMFSLLSTNTPNADSQKKKPDATENTNSRVANHKNHDLRSIIIQGIKDLIDEITSIDEGIESMAVDLIHDNEVLLTPTPDSQTVLKFLLKARQKRKFTVLVTESYPNATSIAHRFAKTLADAKIETVVIPDSHVFAVMSRVGKVIVGAKSVFANGGSICSSGVAAVCESAKEHKTPVFSVTGLYKLSPTYPYDTETLIESGNSGKVISFSNNKLVESADISNPLQDYIPPEHVDIYITNIEIFEVYEVDSLRDNTLSFEINVEQLLQVLKQYERSNADQLAIRLQKRENQVGKRIASLALFFNDSAATLNTVNHSFSIVIRLLRKEADERIVEPELSSVDVFMKLPEDISLLFKRIERYKNSEFITVKGSTQGALSLNVAKEDNLNITLSWNDLLKVQNFTNDEDNGEEDRECEIMVRSKDWKLGSRITEVCRANVLIISQHEALVFHCALDDSEVSSIIYYVNAVKQ